MTCSLVSPGPASRVMTCYNVSWCEHSALPRTSTGRNIEPYPVTQTIGKVLSLITISCAIVHKTDCEVMSVISSNTLYKTQTRNDLAEKSLQNISLLFSYYQWWTRGFVIFRRAQHGMATNNRMLVCCFIWCPVSPQFIDPWWLMWWAVILWNYEPPSQIVYSWPSGRVSLRTGDNPPSLVITSNYLWLDYTLMRSYKCD